MQLKVSQRLVDLLNLSGLSDEEALNHAEELILDEYGPDFDQISAHFHPFAGSRDLTEDEITGVLAVKKQLKRLWWEAYGNPLFEDLINRSDIEISFEGAAPPQPVTMSEAEAREKARQAIEAKIAAGELKPQE